MDKNATGSFSADREGADRMRAVMGATSDAIVTIDAASRIVEVNPATEAMFGFTAKELLGHDVRRLLPLPPREGPDPFVARYLESEEAGFPGLGRELNAHRKDGSTFPVELSLNEIDRTGLSVAVIRDISERRRLEQEVINVAEEERIAVGRELHDGVGSLLTAIKFRTEAFAKSLHMTEGAEAAEIGTIVELVQDAIAQVRAISRGLHPVGAHPEDLLGALRSLARRADRGPDLQCRLECPTPIAIHDQTVANHLFRIAQEAVSNALTHGNGSRIDLALSQTAEAITLRVADNGAGIALERSESEGLGLLTMHSRANAIDAVLRIDPQVGGGTVVTCVLPLAGAKEGRATPRFS